MTFSELSQGRKGVASVTTAMSFKDALLVVAIAYSKADNSFLLFGHLLLNLLCFFLLFFCPLFICLFFFFFFKYLPFFLSFSRLLSPPLFPPSPFFSPVSDCPLVCLPCHCYPCVQADAQCRVCVCPRLTVTMFHSDLYQRKRHSSN